MRCPDCGKIFPSNYYKCNTCNKPLVAEEEYQKLKANSHIPKCPICGSPDVEKIGALERGASIAMLGIFSKKINKSFKCKNCGYTF